MIGKSRDALHIHVDMDPTVGEDVFKPREIGLPVQLLHTLELSLMPKSRGVPTDPKFVVRVMMSPGVEEMRGHLPGPKPLGMKQARGHRSHGRNPSNTCDSN